MSKQGDTKFKIANRVLLVLIIIINTYIIVLPVLPKIQLWLHQRKTKNVAGLPYSTKLDANKNDKRKGIPADNRIVIPKLGMDEHVYEGTSPYTVNKGVWARPKTSTPDKGGNTVMVGHRFTYSGPATFYNLDKVGAGDTIVVYWQGKEYDYTIAETKVVPPTAVQIEAPTKDSQLTVYTCTPLTTAKNRLVLIAKPTQKGNKT